MTDIGTLFVRAGQLGHGVNIKIVLAPLRLIDFLGFRVKMVSYSGVQSAGVIEEGGAWTWGTGRTGASQIYIHAPPHASTANMHTPSRTGASQIYIHADSLL